MGGTMGSTMGGALSQVGTEPGVGPMGNAGAVGAVGPGGAYPARPGGMPMRPHTMPMRGTMPTMPLRGATPQTMLALQSPAGAGQTPSRPSMGPGMGPSMGRPPHMGAPGLATGTGPAMPAMGASMGASTMGASMGTSAPPMPVDNSLVERKKPKTCAQWEMGGCPLGRSCPLAHN